jgi:hypothetical protein
MPCVAREMNETVTEQPVITWCWECVQLCAALEHHQHYLSLIPVRLFLVLLCLQEVMNLVIVMIVAGIYMEAYPRKLLL